MKGREESGAAIETVLAGLRSAEAPEGMERRVLERVREAEESGCSPRSGARLAWSWRAAVGVLAAVLLVLAGVGGMRWGRRGERRMDGWGGGSARAVGRGAGVGGMRLSADSAPVRGDGEGGLGGGGTVAGGCGDGDVSRLQRSGSGFGGFPGLRPGLVCGGPSALRQGEARRGREPMALGGGWEERVGVGPSAPGWEREARAGGEPLALGRGRAGVRPGDGFGDRQGLGLRGGLGRGKRDGLGEEARREEMVAVEEMRAPSLVAPAFPLTKEERLLQRAAERGGAEEMAALSADERAKEGAASRAEFREFFGPARSDGGELNGERQGDGDARN